MVLFKPGRSWPIVRFLSVLFLSLLLPTCGGDSDPTDPPPTPTISITVSPTSLTLDQGTAAAAQAPTTGDVTVNLTRGGEYTGAVTVSLQGAPAGVSAANVTIPSGSASGTLSLVVTDAAAPGTTAMTIRATGSGVTDATANFSLTVNEVLIPGFTIGVDPASITMEQAHNTSSTLTITRENGFAGAVAFAATGQPNAMTVNFDPASATGNTSLVTVAAGLQTPVGTYPLTITGSSNGLPDATTTLTVEVTAGSGGGELVQVRFCNSTGIPTWVAVQDGDGPWVPVSAVQAVGGQWAPPQISIYQFELMEDKAGLAVVQMTDGAAHLDIFHGATTEMGYQGEDHCAGAGLVKTASGTTAGLGPMDIANISLGGASAMVAAGSGVFTYDLTGIRDGLVDLVATSSTLVVSGPDLEVDPQKMIIRRDLDPPDVYTVPLLDFGAPEAFAPAEHILTINNLGTHSAMVSAGYQTANGGGASFFQSFQPAADATWVFPGVPAARQAAGDFHTLLVSSFNPAVNPPSDHRGATLIFEAAAAQTVTLGPVMSGIDAGMNLKVPYVRPKFRVYHQAEYDQYVAAHFSQSDGRMNSVSVRATKGFMGGEDFGYTVPDFTGLDGWNNDWGLQAGLANTTDYSITVLGWSGGGGITGVPFADGALMLFAASHGAFMP